ncbi:MAG: ATP-binding cassette domain-containing protein [Gemmatimonadota bacterium]|nr:ATP-binding cassette domain-containing protein [Gemmatimonadota bacterium]
MLRLRDISLRFPHGSGPLLRKVNLSLEEGSVTGLTGPSGGGKTLLGLVVSGVIPSLIRAELQGSVERALPDEPFRTESAIVFQDPSFQLFSRSVREELLFTPRNLGWPERETGADFEALVSGLNLGELLEQNPQELSMGELQRVALGSALMQRPQVLVLDEPTQYADSFNLARILRFVSLWAQEHKAAVLLIEHHVPLMKEFCRRIYYLDKGRLIENGLPVACFPDFPAGRCNTEKPLIRLSDIKYRYTDPKPVLRGVDLSVFRGESLAVLGPNGSGKSTLAKIICGLYKPRSGRIEFEGEPLLGGREWYKRVGFVMQNPDRQIFAPTVKEECSFGPANFGIPEKVYLPLISNTLSSFRMAGFEKRDPFSLSYGEKRRLNITGILAYSPEILIFDEPTCALDFENQKILLDLVLKMNAEGRTVIIITHDLTFARAACGRAVLLNRGRIAGEVPLIETGEKDVLALCAG